MAFDASNRISNSTIGGAIFDAAGNVIVSGNTSGGTYDQYAYDADGRVCANKHMVVYTPTMTQYVYDANGQRVAKGPISTWPSGYCAEPTVANGFILKSTYLRGNGGEEEAEIDEPPTGSTVFAWKQNVFANGGLLATYSGQTGTGAPAPTLSFNFNDWLGTKRMQVNSIGQLTGYWKSDPFGDYLNSYGSGPDAAAQHFTGKERDAESGNDYFGARYYASTMGRWLSPDPSALDFADPTNPQSLNLYGYVLNNPLINVDPNGMDCAKDNGDGTVTYNSGDCANENEDAANHEYYINCDGCTNGAAGAHLDAATGDLYATDSNGNGMAGTTVQGFADPQGTPATNVTVDGYAPYLDTISGFGIMPDIDTQRIQQLAVGVTANTQHSVGCIAQAYAIEAAGLAASVGIGVPIPGSKPFAGWGSSSGTSVASKALASAADATGVPRGRYPSPTGGLFSGGKPFEMKTTPNAGRAAGRYAPYVGTAITTAAAAAHLWNCL